MTFIQPYLIAILKCSQYPISTAESVEIYVVMATSLGFKPKKIQCQTSDFVCYSNNRLFCSQLHVLLFYSKFTEAEYEKIFDHMVQPDGVSSTIGQSANLSRSGLPFCAIKYDERLILPASLQYIADL